MKGTIEQRIESLESEDDGTETGIRVVEAEELARWWAEEWDGTPAPTVGRGVALVSRELSISEWEQKFGVVEIDTAD